MLQYLFTYLNLLVQDEEGQDLAEYALLIGAIALFVLVAVQLLGTNLSTVFTNIANAVTGFPPGGGGT